MPNIGFVYALSAGANSITIFDQSASSSSATSIGSAVATPWPISDRSTRISTLSSGLMRSHALGANGSDGGGAAPMRGREGRWKPITSPAPATEAAWRNSRRVTSALALMSRALRHSVNGGANPLIGAAATDVRHGGVDVLVAGMGIFREQGRRRHDLTGLAVAALRHVFLDPGLLDRVAAIRRQAFDRRDALAGDGGDGQDAGTGRDAVQMHRAGAALGDAAPELGAGETERVAQDPEQWGVGGDRDRPGLAVDHEGDWGHRERLLTMSVAKTGEGCRVREVW